MDAAHQLEYLVGNFEVKVVRVAIATAAERICTPTVCGTLQILMEMMNHHGNNRIYTYKSILLVFMRNVVDAVLNGSYSK